MDNFFAWTGRMAVLAVAGALMIAPAQADKPAWAGGGKPKAERNDRNGGNDRNGRQRDRDGDRDGRTSRGSYFGDRHQGLVREYYVKEYRSGHCPPGLAKKNNGCMPPGQAKKWQVGRPLPRDVIFHDLPPRLVIELGVPPAGHKFVRVAADILLIAVGTGMVIDAIDDLGRM